MSLASPKLLSCFWCPPPFFSWFDNSGETRSAYEMSDYLDWKAYGYFRLEGHMRAGRYYHHRRRHQPPGKQSVPGADVEPWEDRRARYKEYKRFRGTGFGVRVTSRLPASGELELFVVAGALPNRSKQLVGYLFVHRIGRRKSDWHYYVNGVDTQSDVALARALAHDRRDAHEWVKAATQRLGADWTETDVVAVKPPSRPIVDAEVVRLMGAYGPNRARGGTYASEKDYDTTTTPTTNELLAKADQRLEAPRRAAAPTAREATWIRRRSSGCRRRWCWRSRWRPGRRR